MNRRIPVESLVGSVVEISRLERLGLAQSVALDTTERDRLLDAMWFQWATACTVTPHLTS